MVVTAYIEHVGRMSTMGATAAVLIVRLSNAVHRCNASTIILRFDDLRYGRIGLYYPCARYSTGA